MPESRTDEGGDTAGFIPCPHGIGMTAKKERRKTNFLDSGIRRNDGVKHYNPNSMKSAPSTGFSAYGSISLKPIERYRATAARIEGNVSKRMAA